MNKKYSWISHPNIALVKYWGKRGLQLPANPSLSFTLSKSVTETQLQVFNKGENSDDLLFFFDGNERSDFKLRISNYLLKLADDIPFLNNYSFVIHSKNNFPHSSGIASSASFMSSLAMCIADFEYDYLNIDFEENIFLKRASYLARLGSGSACRSVYAGYSLWGAVASLPHSSDEHAIPMNENIAKVFKSYADIVLVVSNEEKQVSSSAGHELMQKHYYSALRFEQAYKNTVSLIDILERGDELAFFQLIESEAMTLHALMMSSPRWYCLLKPATLIMIEKIRKFREETNLPLGFTLDAGPNVHLICNKVCLNEVLDFVNNELLIYTHNNYFIQDEIGTGPQRVY